MGETYLRFALRRLIADVLGRLSPRRSVRVREAILRDRPQLVDELVRLMDTKKRIGSEGPEDHERLQRSLSAFVLGELRESRKVTAEELAFVLCVGRQLARHGELVKSQLFQDCWALYESGEAEKGFFVEFGAFDGVSHSNTFLLEKAFGWTGVLAEPNPEMGPRIRASRAAPLYEGCVWSQSGETLELHLAEDLSTVADFVGSDRHAERRRESARRALVPTLSLIDLLRKYEAPRVIDFLSIDTEGSELEILREFPISEYEIRAICVEHNGTRNGIEMDALMQARGYAKRFAALSGWDSWYVRRVSEAA